MIVNLVPGHPMLGPFAQVNGVAPPQDGHSIALRHELTRHLPPLGKRPQKVASSFSVLAWPVALQVAPLRVLQQRPDASQRRTLQYPMRCLCSCLTDACKDFQVGLGLAARATSNWDDQNNKIDPSSLIPSYFLIPVSLCRSWQLVSLGLTR